MTTYKVVTGIETLNEICHGRPNPDGNTELDIPPSKGSSFLNLCIFRIYTFKNRYCAKIYTGSIIGYADETKV